MAIQRVVIRAPNSRFRVHLVHSGAAQRPSPHNDPLLNTFTHSMSTRFLSSYSQVIHNTRRRCFQALAVNLRSPLLPWPSCEPLISILETLRRGQASGRHQKGSLFGWQHDTTAPAPVQPPPLERKAPEDDAFELQQVPPLETRCAASERVK